MPRINVVTALLLQNKPVSAPAIGATKVSHIEGAVAASFASPDPEEAAYLEKPYVRTK